MRILLTGRTGQLGRSLERLLPILGGELILPSREECNFLYPKQVSSFLNKYKPTWIINSAAYTDVEKAENDWNSCFLCNASSVAELAQYSKNNNTPLIHYSTEYVFNGYLNRPYQEEDRCSPINAYGYSKYLGEQLIQSINCFYMILRISWLYSHSSNNFFHKIMRKKEKELMVVDDQIGAPTWSEDVAWATIQLIRLKQKYLGVGREIFHISPSGFVSRYEWAQIIVEKSRKNQKVYPVSSIFLGKKGPKRPLNSRLSSDNLSKLGIQLPNWKNSFLKFWEAH